MRRITLRITSRILALLGARTLRRSHAGSVMSREMKSVRVDAELLAELERLARERRVPVTFAAQVDRALRLLVKRGRRRAGAALGAAGRR